MEPRLNRANFEDSSDFDFFSQYGIVVFSKERDEFIRVSPFNFVAFALCVVGSPLTIVGILASTGVLIDASGTCV
jgi:hypothetical protein